MIIKQNANKHMVPTNMQKNMKVKLEHEFEIIKPEIT
jgi:hypothetical protein